MKITFIGAGNMAEAIVAGIVGTGIVEADDICVADISEERLELFESGYGARISKSNAAAVADADVVVLSVKPQVFPAIWPEVVGAIRSDALVVSIMAGIPSRRIAGDQPIRVVRVMPNTPSLVGQGAAGIAPGEHAEEYDLEVAASLLAAVGSAVIVREEDLDAVTALSGSGPAYVFYLLEGMLEAAGSMGLDAAVSRELALQTVIGAAVLMKETGETADVLRRKVTSPGGTTAAAIDALEAHGVRASIVEALLAAQERSRELADG